MSNNTYTSIETFVPFMGFYDWFYEYIDEQFSSEYVRNKVESWCEKHNVMFDNDLYEKWLSYQNVYLGNPEEEMNKYARIWTEIANNYVELDLEFVEIDSPREYNFSNDKIVAKMPWNKYLEMRHNLLTIYRKEFESYINDVLEPRDGFFPFYSNTLNSEDWKNEVWEIAQIGIALDFYMMKKMDVDSLHDLWSTLQMEVESDYDPSFYPYEPEGGNTIPCFLECLDENGDTIVYEDGNNVIEMPKISAISSGDYEVECNFPIDVNYYAITWAMARKQYGGYDGLSIEEIEKNIRSNIFDTTEMMEFA